MQREVSNYRLYRDTMERIVEIAAHRKMTVAEYCDHALNELASQHYLAMVGEKLKAEQERLSKAGNR